MTAKRYVFLCAALTILLTATVIVQATPPPARPKLTTARLSLNGIAPAPATLQVEQESDSAPREQAAALAIASSFTGYDNLGVIPLDGCENWECEWIECPELCDGF
jgi:hypothetical protein